MRSRLFNNQERTHIQCQYLKHKQIHTQGKSHIEALYTKIPIIIDPMLNLKLIQI
jgi:hypothetical protein